MFYLYFTKFWFDISQESISIFCRYFTGLCFYISKDNILIFYDMFWYFTGLCFDISQDCLCALEDQGKLVKVLKKLQSKYIYRWCLSNTKNVCNQTTLLKHLESDITLFLLGQCLEIDLSRTMLLHSKHISVFLTFFHWWKET